MKKLSLLLLLSWQVSHTLPPSLPAFPVAIKNTLTQPTAESGLNIFKELPYYKLVKAIEQNVYLFSYDMQQVKKQLETLDNYFKDVYARNVPVDEKIKSLTDSKKLQTVPGLSVQLTKTMSNLIS